MANAAYALQLAQELAISHLLLHCDYASRCQLALDLARLGAHSMAVRMLMSSLLTDSSLEERTQVHRRWLAEIDDWCSSRPVPDPAQVTPARQ
jgi:hypothetical protein